MTEQTWHCAVKNTTTDKHEWYYHLFYDFDGIKLNEKQIKAIVDYMKDCNQSFILRHTMHGYHLIGLTPNKSMSYTGMMFDAFQKSFPTYHDGQAIRITKKMQDEFIIVAENYSFPVVVKLANLFGRFKYIKDDTPLTIQNQWYVLLYYTTNKKNIKNKEVIAKHDKEHKRAMYWSDQIN